MIFIYEFLVFVLSLDFLSLIRIINFGCVVIILIETVNYFESLPTFFLLKINNCKTGKLAELCKYKNQPKYDILVINSKK